MKLSVVIPIYNERESLAELLARVRAVELDKEIVCVDDCSTDGTREILAEEARRGDLVVVEHAVNRGKGAAVQSGLRAISGDVVVIQDADLEYDPQDYHVLLRPIQAGRSKVVYGSRFLGEHRAMRFWHSVGNKGLTLVTNLLYDTTLTDMETCYKVFTADVAKRSAAARAALGVRSRRSRRASCAPATASTRCPSPTPAASTTRGRRSPGATASSCSAPSSAAGSPGNAPRALAAADAGRLSAPGPRPTCAVLPSLPAHRLCFSRGQ